MTTPLPADAPPAPRWHRLMLAAIVVIGIALRVAWFDTAVIEHYDEGVYASNLYLASDGFAYPDRHLYAPPLWPWVIEWTITFLGPNAATWPSMVAGSLLILAVYVCGRDWFAPSVGLLAGGLVATDPMLVLYSRTALVDVPMALLLTISLWLGSRGIASGRWPAVITAGLAAGLAWATKYNGWLSLAIMGTATLVWTSLSRVWRGPLPRLAVVSLVATCCWVPILIGLRDVGGYAAVAENHARYFVGLSGWLASAATQCQHAAFLGQTICAPLTVAVIGFGLARIGGRTFVVRLVLALVILVAVVLFDVPVVAPLFGGLIGVAIWQAANAIIKRETSHALGEWIVLVWVISLAVAIPLYAPYPRLLVPLLPAAALLTARLLLPATMTTSKTVSGREETRRDEATRFRVVLGVVLIVATINCSQSAAFDDRSGVREAATVIVKQLERIPLNDHDAFAVYVLNEPALFFHLAAQQGDARVPYVTVPAGNLVVLDAAGTNPRLKPLLAYGPHVGDDVKAVERGGLATLLSTSAPRSRLVVSNDTNAGEGNGQSKADYRLVAIDD